MPNIINAQGLQTKTLAEVTEQIRVAFETLYGPDVNFGSDTPDGQLIGNFGQQIIDLLELINQVYTGFDPDQAIGVILDQRCAINGVQRQAGTHTITPITVVVDRALTLVGIEEDPVNPYTIADDTGREWQLISSVSPSGAGTAVYNFQAKETGAISTIPNTITIPVTIVIGVVSVNNPTSYLTLGIQEETDAELRIRRQKSVSLSSQGYLEGLIAALENIPEVTSVMVYENVTGVTDGDGVPGHAIWVIVSGGNAEDIANAIYRKRNAGCNMKGSQTYVITQPNGTFFTIRWDYVESEDFWIEFDASPIDGVTPIDTAYIANQLALLFKPGVAEKVNINELATIVQQINPNCLVTNAGFSFTEMGSYTSTLTPTAKNKQFVVDAAKINITAV